ncbi:putative E3 ubiquitin-protein ligase UBR7 isoform X8 [Dreissena polymorpha]|uniref:putative E3 ubiquitin-protein ligase UBR7 isoform X7 n=1 Tax=Dreissena polymorpha TaxID=45954 RepID=UPI002263D1F6|nr:putative E3 ubiquitin-protein ligase UBR7 isoform X7 [Dreissena polymorpha]XP_052263793.1 putative E3 ubiquitin-protein ligase UBR7 isoform X8 [Dreissena polymorpha]
MAENIEPENALEENENENDAVISMVDYLKEEEELENDANAVLGGSDDTQCTYSLGYVPRQALYACSTCNTKDGASAGVCLACSYACHEGHDLYELYTKRNFRCDCGNSKFLNLTCKLCPDKGPENTDNVYNQNFKGLYCVCARPYPDPEDEIEDLMIQCIVCEDWYHGRHLGDCQVPAYFSEMVCQGCMNKHSFLWAYFINCKDIQVVQSDSSVNSSEIEVEKSGSSLTSDVSQSRESEKSATSLSTGSDDTSLNTSSTESQSQKADSSESRLLTGTNGSGTSSESELSASNDVSLTSGSAASSSCDSTSKEQCLLRDLQTREVTHRNSATFWPDNFRSKLCQCSPCKTMYAEQKVEFLINDCDHVAVYENQGLNQSEPSSEEERERQVLGSMNRVQQIEMVQGFNDMKSALSDYLKRFAENGKVVRAEDIREFFSQMEQRKRQKTEHTPAHFCR